MQYEMCVAVENAGNSKLLALFNTLEERDKDIVITISELLLKKWQINMNSIQLVHIKNKGEINHV